MPFPSPGDLPDPGIKPRSPALQANALPASREAPSNNQLPAKVYLLLIHHSWQGNLTDCCHSGIQMCRVATIFNVVGLCIKGEKKTAGWSQVHPLNSLAWKRHVT